MDVTDCLFEIKERAALIRFFGTSTAASVDYPDSDVFGGIGWLGEDIERLVEVVRKALTPEELTTPIRTRHGYAKPNDSPETPSEG